ncbi:MAG: archaeosortase H N-terminal-like domain-containing protein [Promethearchaeota archaeon]|jgi:hypothetical protein
MEQIIKKKIIIWLLLTINLLFAFVIGYTIPLLTSESSNILGLLMIPLLIVLNYIILDRFHYHTKKTEDVKVRPDEEI